MPAVHLAGRPMPVMHPAGLPQKMSPAFGFGASSVSPLLPRTPTAAVAWCVLLMTKKNVALAMLVVAQKKLVGPPHVGVVAMPVVALRKLVKPPRVGVVAMPVVALKRLVRPPCVGVIALPSARHRVQVGVLLVAAAAKPKHVVAGQSVVAIPVRVAVVATPAVAVAAVPVPVVMPQPSENTSLFSSITPWSYLLSQLSEIRQSWMTM